MTPNFGVRPIRNKIMSLPFWKGAGIPWAVWRLEGAFILVIISITEPVYSTTYRVQHKTY